MTDPTMTIDEALDELDSAIGSYDMEYGDDNGRKRDALVTLRQAIADHERLTAIVVQVLAVAQEYVAPVVGILQQTEGGPVVVAQIKAALEEIELQVNTGRVKEYGELRQMIVERDEEIRRLRAALEAVITSPLIDKFQWANYYRARIEANPLDTARAALDAKRPQLMSRG